MQVKGVRLYAKDDIRLEEFELAYDLLLVLPFSM